MVNASPLGIVTGSGLDLRPLLGQLVCERSFDTVPGLRRGGVPGHGYVFTHGRCGGRQVVIQQGRLHLYEGLGYADVVRTVDALLGYGVGAILFTNVVGGLLTGMRPGDLVAVEAVKPWRYLPWKDQPEVIPTDFLVPGCAHAGTYFWMHGPCYETRAEIAALRSLGGAVVGMSTAPELARCRELGIPAGVVSCVTNCCGSPEALTHEQVLATARRASAKLVTLIRNALPEIAANPEG